jgi:hypothetical protein
MEIRFVTILLVALVAGAGTARAADSGFLSDYSKLTQAAGEVGADRMYLAEGAVEKAGAYSGVFVEQPEFFIAEDSKYKGIKPDELKVLADSMREAVVRELHGDFSVVDIPEEGVLGVRIGLSNVHLQKKKRGLLGYTPVGAVAFAVKKSFDDLMQKVQLKGAVLEVEITDAATGEVLAAVVESRGLSGEEATSWAETQSFFSLVGQRIACRLSNARVPEGEHADCLAIQEAPADE